MLGHSAKHYTLEKAQLPECINLNATLPIHKEKNFTTKIKEKLHKEEELRIINEIQMCGPETKLRTYMLFKTTSGMEPYLAGWIIMALNGGGGRRERPPKSAPALRDRLDRERGTHGQT